MTARSRQLLLADLGVRDARILALEAEVSRLLAVIALALLWLRLDRDWAKSRGEREKAIGLQGRIDQLMLARRAQ